MAGGGVGVIEQGEVWVGAQLFDEMLAKNGRVVLQQLALGCVTVS